MSRRPLVGVALVTAAALSIVPAHAATKPKPKPIKGSYNVTLYPDVTPDVTGQVGDPPVCGALPQSMDKHAFKVPAAGKLVVKLVSPDPTPAASPVHADWDLWILDSKGEVIDGSHSEFATEETSDKFKKATPVTFLVCNVSGQTTGTVSYTFTYA